MLVSSLKYQDTKLFSKLINDYLDGKLDKSLCAFENSFDGFENKIQERKNYKINRNLLKKVLLKQNSKLSLSDKSLENINLLEEENTFTLTTGHQLNIMGGPLYFVYKIASTIKLAIQLKESFPNENFVPVFWMATEDHDFEEINHFYFEDSKISWDSEQKGAVGRFKNYGLDLVFEEFSKLLPANQQGDYLSDLFRKAYLENSNLADATRYLVNHLFGEFGIIIIDGDDAMLKNSFKEIVKKELIERLTFSSISKTNNYLADNSYKIQVNPRDINLFFLEDQKRERISFDDEEDKYYLVDSKLKFSESEILNILEETPGKFSPNVVTRPLYQEFVLPNLAYIGGGGELAYWLQLKENFSSFGISFPILTLRDSVLLIDSWQYKKMQKLNISIDDLFSPPENVIERLAEENSNIDLSEDFQSAGEIFDNIISKLGDDHPMAQSFEALKAKQLKILDQASKKLNRYNKKQIEDLQSIVYKIFDFTSPKGKIQERRMNFSTAYLLCSNAFIQTLIDVFEPLEDNFTVLINN